MKHWRREKDDAGITLVTIDSQDKDVNTLNEEVVRELDQLLDDIKTDSSVRGIVFTSAKRDFIVGADIKEISGFSSAEEAEAGAKNLQEVFQKLADLKVPTVAAISGQALGGGMEFSLACQWRILAKESKTKLGLPEIQLGLIPGAGGTQRLPRLIGIQSALDLILTGRKVAGRKAQKMGLADAVVPKQQLMEYAKNYAVKKRPEQKALPDLVPAKLGKDLPKWATEGNPIGRKVIQKKAKEMVDEKTKGFYPASYKALEAVFDGYETSLQKGLALEAKLFGQLAFTRESQSLIHLYFATNKIKKHAYLEAGKEKFGETPIKQVGIVGAGFMGAGIATVCADRNIQVRFSDPSEESNGKALAHARNYFKKKRDRRRIKPHELGQRMMNISPGLNPSGFGQTDLVIEAVFEDLGLKQKILAGLEKIDDKDFIFATNTSALPIKDIAAKSKDPSRVIGMHFFSPVEKMPLLEVVVTDQTADWVASRVIEFGQRLGKQVITVKDGPGFYTTRALCFFLNEATNMLMEGAPIEYIDQALTEFGFPVGPITLIDEVGIDVSIHVLETIESAFEDRMTAPKGLAPVAESGRLGRKNNKGFYIYENGKKIKPDHSIYELLGINVSKSKMGRDLVVDRCLYVFVNESIRCLEDGVLFTPYDGDIGAVFGLGFPPFWGGPFRYVDHLGARTVVDRLNELASQFGPRFKPAPLLVKYAEEGKKFFPDE